MSMPMSAVSHHAAADRLPAPPAAGEGKGTGEHLVSAVRSAEKSLASALEFNKEAAKLKAMPICSHFCNLGTAYLYLIEPRSARRVNA